MNGDEIKAGSDTTSLNDAPLQHAHLMDVVQPRLRPLEKVLWLGQPDPQRLTTQYLPHYFKILGCTAVPVLLLAAFGREFWFPEGAPFISVPFLLVFGAFVGWVVLIPCGVFASARRTVYALTDQRILIIKDGQDGRFEAYTESSLGEIKRIERADESGDLIFARRKGCLDEGLPPGWDIKLVGIPQVASVESLLRRTFNKAE